MSKFFFLADDIVPGPPNHRLTIPSSIQSVNKAKMSLGVFLCLDSRSNCLWWNCCSDLHVDWPGLSIPGGEEGIASRIGEGGPNVTPSPPTGMVDEGKPVGGTKQKEMDSSLKTYS